MGGSFTVIVTIPMAVTARESNTPTRIGKVPAWVGVPPSEPLELVVIPGGIEANVQKLPPAPPVAVRVPLKGCPNVAERLVVVMVSAG